MKKTFSAKAEEVQRQWFVIDADKKVVGRVAEKVANVIRGKHKAIYTPHCDTGDNVIVINADKAVFTGKKETQKSYMSYCLETTWAEKSMSRLKSAASAGPSF